MTHSFDHKMADVLSLTWRVFKIFEKIRKIWQSAMLPL
jgi:hypothetical protein